MSRNPVTNDAIRAAMGEARDRIPPSRSESPNPGRRDHGPDRPSRGDRDAHPHRDRPGQPHRSDIDKVDRAIADRHARHPQHTSERQAIWTKIREASDTFGEARTEDPSRGDARSGRGTEPLSAADRRPEAGLEITGMRLPEDFDDGDVHWLRRYHEKAPDLAPPNGADGVARKPDAPSLEQRIEEAEPDAPARGEPLPTGDRLAEPDEDDASRLEKLRAKLFEKDFLGDLESAAAEWGDIGHDCLPVHRPTGHAEVRSPHVTPSVEHQHQGVDGGDAVTAVIFGSIVASDMARRLYHRIDDWKEARRNARDG